MLTWSTFEGPDFRYIFAQAVSGNILYILLAVVWLGMFVWLYKTQEKKNVSYE